MTVCSREPEVLDAVVRGVWNDATTADLRRHAADCATCTDAAAIVDVLRADHDAALRAAVVPSAGAVWWRATMRARADAARAAERPLTVVQGLAGAAVAGVALAFGGLVWHELPAGLSLSPLVIAALALAVCVVLTPLAVVFALKE